MREISRSEHEMILNLFIIEFMGWYMPKTECQYLDIINANSLFDRIKDVFPMDEICKEFEFNTGDIKTVSWIRGF